MKKTIILTVVAFFFLSSVVLADTIKLEKSNKVIIGKIIKETHTDYVVKLKGGGTTQFPKSWVKEIIEEEIPDEELYTISDVYHKKLQLISPDDARANLELALWCLENNLFEVAEKHFRVAKALNPKLSRLADRKIAMIENMRVERMYAYAKGDVEAGHYLTPERVLLDLIRTYPNSDYVGFAEDLLVIIWGEKRAKKLILEKDELPQAALSEMELTSILRRLETEELKEAYLKKCLNKARDFEERADEVDQKIRQSYILNALNCYELILNSGNHKFEDAAQAKVNSLNKEVLKNYPLPETVDRKTQICKIIEKTKDEAFIEELCSQYYKFGKEYQKEAVASKVSIKKEKALVAYNCYSIVYYFSKEEDLKQEAFKMMAECQRLIE